MNTNLVVADASRTEKTICLAVSLSLKSFGISGRARLFEVVQKVKEVNLQRKACAPGHTFTGESYFSDELLAHPELSVSYIIAPPRMAHYMEYVTRKQHYAKNANLFTLPPYLRSLRHSGCVDNRYTADTVTPL